MSAVLGLRVAPPAAFRFRPAVIRSAVEGERRALASLRRFGPETVDIMRAELGSAYRKSPAARRPVVGVMTDRPRSHVWLRGGDHLDIHCRRHVAGAEAPMAAAGFGPAPPAHSPEPVIS